MSVTLTLFEKIWFQCKYTSQNTEFPVSYSVYLLFNYIFIKYLIICEQIFLVFKVFMLHIFF